MSLKQDIVIVNEYSVKDKKTGKGSRGSTPGDYVTRYMARDNATETASFVAHRVDDFVLEYMARTTATESAFEEIKKEYEQRDEKWDGVAFNHRKLSLSKKELKDQADRIQQGFDKGKTVMKTVISFDTEYLREHGIIPEDLIVAEKGDFRSNVDQMKLRQAIFAGLEAFSSEYDDLEYVGVIQVDTLHVHTHLTLIDMGRGNLTEDGTQRGKLSDRGMMKIRRQIDASLNESKAVAFMPSNADLNKRNLKITIQKSIYEHISEFGVPQMLFAVLPEDKKSWRANSNAKDMRTAHKICRTYIDLVFEKYPDEMQLLFKSFDDYVENRRIKEGLSKKKCEDLRKTCEENFYKECENSIYKALKQIPDKYKTESTDFFSLATDDELVNSGSTDIYGFVYRLKAYTKRYDKHRQLSKRYAKFIEEYKEADKNNNVTDESRALYNFFVFEQEYQMELSSKYSQMLFVSEPDDDLADTYIKITNKADAINNLKLLREDKDLKKYKTVESLSDYAKDVYGIYVHIDWLLYNPDLFDKYIEEQEEDYQTEYDSFIKELNARSKTITYDDDGSIHVVRYPAYDFDEIRGLDLQDVRYDFGPVLEFDGLVRTSFMNCAEQRLALFEKAYEYLVKTDQTDVLDIFDLDDIDAMRDVYSKLLENQPILNDRKDDDSNFQIRHKSVVNIDVAVCDNIYKNLMINMEKEISTTDKGID